MKNCCEGKYTGCCTTATAPGSSPEPSNVNIPFGLGMLAVELPKRFTTQEILDVMRAVQEGPVREIFVRNNAAYAETDRTDDGFNNFREGAAESGIDVLQYWGVLFGKHRRALSTFVRTKNAHKPVWRVIKDMIVYLHMLNAYLIEQGEYTLEDVLGDEDDG
jgi:hypothetical protein